MPPRWFPAVLARIRELAAQRKVHFTLTRDELASLAASEFAERLRSKRTGEWMYIFKPEVGGVPVYLKVILRTDCVVISCHVEKEQSHEDD